MTKPIDEPRRDLLIGAGSLALVAAAASATAAVPPQGKPEDMPGLSPEPWITLDVVVGQSQIYGTSEGFERRCSPIISGKVSGRFTGEIVPGGADWQRVLPDGTTELAAHYGIRTSNGSMIEAHSNGLRSGPPEAMKALLAGERVDPALIYFRSSMRFLTADPTLRDFATKLFVGIGKREPDRVRLAVHLLL